MKESVARTRGQGQVEYILLIALVCLFIVGALLWFRDAVADYTLRVADWIEGKPPTEVATASLPPPPPTPTPAPTPPPDPLAGDWCVDDIDTGRKNMFTLRFEPADDGTYRVLRGGPGVEFAEAYVATPTGPDQFTFAIAWRPEATWNFARQPDGSFSGAGWIFRRC